jgi:hypothetical protein
MLPYLLLLSFISIILSFEPPCSSCKHFISNNKGALDLGLCKMFTNKLSLKGDDVALPNFARHCRNDEQLCGKIGFLYEPANNNGTETASSTISADEREIINEYEDLKNRCCGEVNEDNELEQLEREFFEVFQKIKRHNRKRVYKTSQELYKLFKKK